VGQEGELRRRQGKLLRQQREGDDRSLHDVRWYMARDGDTGSAG
jgi:hypothetical protein